MTLTWSLCGRNGVGNGAAKNKFDRTAFVLPTAVDSPAMITKIVSGGQTGADRAGLDVAIRYGIPHGGWCPKGRRAEDGPIGGQYLLTETPSSSYLQRTEWNVRDSDATVIFTLASQLSGGSKRTAEFAAKHRKPWIHLARESATDEDAAQALQRFVRDNSVGVLNVAGTRGSREQALPKWVESILEAIMEQSEKIVEKSKLFKKRELHSKSYI
jgi:hypothetical protein